MITAGADDHVFKNLEIVHKTYAQNPVAMHLRFSGPVSDTLDV